MFWIFSQQQVSFMWRKLLIMKPIQKIKINMVQNDINQVHLQACTKQT